MRYFLEISYNGIPFHGWQRQPNAVSVQEELERSLSIVFQKEILITGAGRTDTGVHARQMFAHFDVPGLIEDDKTLIRSLNRLCGPNIAIKRIISVAKDAHARFDASERTYKYFIIYQKSPFLKDFSWFSPTPLDLDRMNEAARLLLDTKDFTSFAKLHTDVKTNICDVRRAYWENYENLEGVPGIVFTISADRFLRNMVRAIVGTLVEVGRGKKSVSDFRSVIESADRCTAGTSMPGEGLFLWEVKYPYII